MRRFWPLLPALACALALAAPAAQAAPTGRVLVLLRHADGTRAQASAAHAFLARTRARAAVTVPEIGLLAARPPAGRPRGPRGPVRPPPSPARCAPTRPCAPCSSRGR